MSRGAAPIPLTQRPATNADAEAVQRIVSATLEEYGLRTDPQTTDADLTDLDAAYAGRGGILLVLEEPEGRVVGCGGLYALEEGEWEIRKMYLLPEARGRGEGRRLLHRLMGEARWRSARRVVLETAAVLKEAIALYEAYGFERYDPPHLSSRCDQAYALTLPGEPPPGLETRPTLRAAGLSTRFRHCLSPEANNAEVLGALWGDFLARLGEIPDRTGEPLVGIVRPIAPGEQTHPDELLYLAGAPVTRQAALPEGIVAWEIPETTFAVFEHRGPIVRIVETIERIFREWLPAGPWEHSGIADIEVYGESFDPVSEDSVMDYLVSVRPRTPQPS